MTFLFTRKLRGFACSSARCGFPNSSINNLNEIEGTQTKCGTAFVSAFAKTISAVQFRGMDELFLNN